MNAINQINEIIELETRLCIAEARRNGYEGRDDEYALTAKDCEAIADARMTAMRGMAKISAAMHAT